MFLRIKEDGEQTLVSATRHFLGEKNKETTRFRKAAKRSTPWGSVLADFPPQPQGSRSPKALGGGECGGGGGGDPAGATPKTGKSYARVRVQPAASVAAPYQKALCQAPAPGPSS